MPTALHTTATATIDVRRDQRRGRIDSLIYGHFLESAFFANIEGGVFDEGSPLSYEGPDVRNGLRRDVIALCRELGLPIVRWPGGNFTSAYHWEDGVGPRDTRPRRLELAWGEEESNGFGTDEFLAWCAEVGTEPYLAHSCRDVDEAVRWVEYANHAGDTSYTRQRAANGHPEPYGVKYWGLGNEVYGQWQMGHRTAVEYAAAAREHAQFMRAVDPSLKFVAVGLDHDRQGWTDTVLEAVGDVVDYVSLHLYGATTQLADGPMSTTRSWRSRNTSSRRSRSTPHSSPNWWPATERGNRSVWHWTSGTSGTSNRRIGRNRSLQTTVGPPSGTSPG